LSQVISDVTRGLDEFKYSDPLNQLYRFFWNDFCDWYVEWAKPRVQDAEQRGTAQNVLAFVLDQALRLLHPFIPFVTEGIFQKLNKVAPVRGLEGIAGAEGADALVIASWPNQQGLAVDEYAEEQIAVVQEAIRAIRDIRSKYNKVPSELLNVSARAAAKSVDILNQNAELIGQLAGVDEFSAGVETVKPANAAVSVLDDATQLYTHDVIDPAAERVRLLKQKEQMEKARKGTEAKLNNENFISKAKPEVVSQARARLAELTEQLQSVEQHLSELTD